MLHRKGVVIICLLLACWGTSSFKDGEQPAKQVYHYYDAAIDSLIHAFVPMEAALAKGGSIEVLKEHFRQCRLQYKSISFLLQYLDMRSARLLNGPDLLRMEEENPADSLKPHGFQVMERCLYGSPGPDTAALHAELLYMQVMLSRLLVQPDRGYQFTDANIWTAMRTGVYGIITLDLTGFDAPLSRESIPGAMAQLWSIRTLLRFYGEGPDGADPELKVAMRKADDAIGYLIEHQSFNDIDRLYLIRSYLNPLSASLSACALKHGYYNRNERTAINLQAQHLFAPDIFNLSFFSPNEQFLPTPERISLGRKLFYDAALSGSHSRSCGSCHQPQHAFTDGLITPLKISGGRLPRNTPTLWNSALQTRQFYDLRTDKLENQLSAVVHNEEEMGGSLARAAIWLRNDSAYSAAFRKAYPGMADYINAYNIANAISGYVRSLVSLNSPFDRYIRGQTAFYPAAASRGFNLFMGKAGCGTCHYAPLFNGLVPALYGDTEAEVLGVPAGKGKHSVIDRDEGKAGYTRLPLHRFAFKTPTLRNIALTAPYMHNGVFSMLDEVIDFYSDGGGAGRGIIISNQTLPAEKLHLNGRDRKDIIAFLETLTDTSGHR